MDNLPRQIHIYVPKAFDDVLQWLHSFEPRERSKAVCRVIHDHLILGSLHTLLSRDVGTLHELVEGLQAGNTTGKPKPEVELEDDEFYEYGIGGQSV